MNYHKFILLFLSLICFFPAGFLGQSDESCPSFRCGNISLITNPFWDRAAARRNEIGPNITQPLCGHPDFGLHCRGSVATLVISPLHYRVLDIDFSNRTLKLLRQDLWENPCDPFLPAVDTAFVPSTLFSILPSYNHSYLTIHYSCTPGPGSNTNKGYLNFTCGETGTRTTNILRVGQANASMADFDFTCRLRTTVPLNESAAAELQASTASPLDALHAALVGGFLVQWSADDVFCSNCTRLRLACLYDPTTKKPLCDSPTRTGRPIDRNRGAVGPPQAPPNQAAPNPNGGSPKMANNTRNLPTNFNHGASKNRTRLALGVAFGGIGFILMFILISWLCKRQHCPDGTSGPTNPNIEKFILQQESLATKRYRYSDIKKITKSFSEKLGQGGYGSVYKGMLPSGSPVAVKLLFETDSNDEEFINEVASISRTSHVNIVSLLGFCYERNKRALIYEFMPNKSVDKFIRDTNASQDVEKLYNISIGVAKGLEYLHTGCNSRIVHFDIKPQNILLDESFCPKISDFGLAKLCKKKQSILSVEGMRGTTGYIAPEVYSRNFGSVSHKSDVYSFGVMLLEMAGAKKFVEPDSIQSSENYFPDKIYEHVVNNVDHEPSMLKQEDDERVRKMFFVGFWCMQTIPSDRPSISKVVEMLEGKIESIPIPPKPFLFNPEQRGEGFSSLMPIGSEIEASNEISFTTTETTWKTSTEEGASLESKR